MKRVKRPLVYVMYTHKGEKTQFSTGIRVKDEDWDREKKSIRKFDPNFDLMQQQIDKTVERVRTIVYETIIRHGEPKVHLVRELYDRSLNNSGKGYRQMKAEYLSERAERFTLGTLKNDYRFFNKVSEWCGTMNVHTFSKSDISDFAHWLYSKRLYNNTVTRYMVTLKTFLRWGYEKGYHTNLVWKTIKTNYEVNNVVFLTKGELDLFRVVQLPEWMEKYRDMYLFMAYTGMSISDAKRFRYKDVIDGFIRYDRQKSGTEAFIPYTKRIQMIVERYEGKLPDMSEQKLNKHIKEIARLSGIDREIVLVKKIKDKPKITRIPKWKAITSHTARKTFVTLCMQKNVTEVSIMQMGGYADAKSLQPYRGVDLSHIRDQYNRLEED